MKKKLTNLVTLTILGLSLSTNVLVLATEIQTDDYLTTRNDSQVELSSPEKVIKETLPEDASSEEDAPKDTSLDDNVAETTESTVEPQPEDDPSTKTSKSLPSEKEVQSQMLSKENINQYLTITNGTSPLYDEWSEVPTKTVESYLNQTLLAKEKITTEDSQVFYSLYNNQQIFIGYVEADTVTLAKNPGGAYQTYGKYVTITKNNYSIWGGFTWQFKASTNDYYQKTLFAQGIYYHFSGSRYLSLYDKDGKWHGYLNENATTLASGSQGIYQPFGKYVTIAKGHYDLWQNFNWTPKAKAQTILEETVLARGVYQHFNGSRYLSLYNKDGKWLGYLNENGARQASGPQGTYQSFGKYVTITKNNYTIWQNFAWKSKNSSNNLYQQTYLARGRYHHYNGSTYVSLFNNKGVWQGYLNQDAVTLAKTKGGAPLKMNKTITVTKNNYTIWRNLNFSSGKSTRYLVNKPMHVAYKYNHFNGSTYYSLYDQSKVWQGYLNVTGLAEVAGDNSTYVLMNAPFIDQNSAGAPMGCEAASLLEALHTKGYAQNYRTLRPFLNEMPIAKDRNPHNGFAGSPWLVTPGIYQSIFAKPLAKWGNKYAHNKVVDISGTNFDQLKNELIKGNPLVVYVTLDFQKGYWGYYFWGKGVDNAHIMTVDGYNSRTNQYHVADPNRGTYWVNANKFEAAYNLTKGAVVVR